MIASVDEAREFVAESREEAISKAEGFFRASADQLDVWVVPDTFQVSGLGSRVLVIAALRSSKPSAREERRPERREERREERRPERSERAERPARRERADEPRRERPAERSERSEAATRPERAEPRPAPRRAEAETVEEPIEDVEDGELGPVGEFIAGILERMKLREVAITESETDDGDIIITLAGKSIVALADRDARLAAALSHLAHRAAETLVDEDAGARVEIRGARRPQRDEASERPGRDNRRGGGRPERPASRRDSDDRDVDEVALERMAREGAEIVRRSGEAELLRPMTSRERWVVHNALKDESGVRSESEGEGPRKRIRITPA